MSNLPSKENPGFPGVYQLEETDPVVGGPDGVDNLPHKQLAERDDHILARTQELETASEDHEGRLQTVEVAGATSVGRAFPLYLEQNDKGAEFELFSEEPYSWRDYDPSAVLGTIAGDESVDVESTNNLNVGDFYVIADPDGTFEVIEVSEILTSTRFRATSTIGKTRSNSGTLSRTTWDVRPAYAWAGDGAYFSKQLRTFRFYSEGRVLLRRDDGDGSISMQARRVNDPVTGWQNCGLRMSSAKEDGRVDLEFAVPVGGLVELRIDTAKGPSGDRMRIDHIMALTPVRAERADHVRQPTNVSPADGVTGEMETPTLEGDGYFSLYGIAQGGAEFEVATDADFANVVYTGSESGAGTQHAVASGNLSTDTVYFWRVRYQDQEGTWSPWSEPTGFSTGAVFEYVEPPTVASPAAGATDVSLTPTITTDAFNVIGATDTHSASQYQVASDSGFTSIVYDSGEISDLTEHTVPGTSSLARDTEHYIRVRHKGAAQGLSDWSPVRSFRTANVAYAPSILSPSDGATDASLTPTIQTSAFSYPGGGEAHVATKYQVATDSGFTSIVYDSGDSSDLTSHEVPSTYELSPLTTHYVRARHKGGTTGYSPWSGASSFQTGDVSSKVGSPGGQGFGVSEYPGDLPVGYSAMTGTSDPASDNYGNYTYSDGSVLVFVPRFYYRIGDASNPTYGAYGANSIDVKGAEHFSGESEANAAGYTMHRAFMDGGQSKSGFFVDKYLASTNGAAAKSVKNGTPISLTTNASYTNSQGMGYSGQLSDAVEAARARGTGFNCASAFMYSALAMLSLAHAQAAAGTAECAWYDSSGTTNYPKGSNSSLGDVDDGVISYTASGESDKPLTGSGTPFEKTTHNGQACGVADLNGGIWQVGIGVTIPGGSDTASGEYTADLGVWVLKDSIALADVTGGWNGAMDAWRDASNIGGLYTKQIIPIAQGDNKQWGNGSNPSLSGAQTGAGYVTDSIGLAVDDSGVSSSGTNLYGQDRHYFYRRENLVPYFAGYWNLGAGAGVFYRTFYSYRSSDGSYVGFRAAAYGPQ